METRYLKRFHHPNIVRSIKCFAHKGRSFSSFCFMDEVNSVSWDVLAMERMGKSLKHYLEPGSPLYDQKGLIRNIASALAYIHTRGVIHGDLSVNNICAYHNCDKLGPFVLIDFGAARKYPCEMHANSLYPLDIRPPEMTGEDKDTIVCITSAADMWALGCLLYKMLFSESLIGDALNKAHNQLHREQVARVVELVKGRLLHRDLEAMNLLRRLLTLNPEDRITAEEVLAHPWLTERTEDKKITSSPVVVPAPAAQSPIAGGCCIM
jgi:serine/threonine protein kinase